LKLPPQLDMDFGQLKTTTEDIFVCPRPRHICDFCSFFDAPCIYSFTYLLTKERSRHAKYMLTNSQSQTDNQKTWWLFVDA